MAKRIVQECDLTKQEYDPAETVTLVIKRSGKKQGRTYELSPEAASKLEQQLVSGNKLPTGWSFSGSKASVENPWHEADTPITRTLADLDNDDDALVAKKKREMKDEGVDTSEPREKVEGQATVLPVLETDDSQCLHMNKGHIQTTLKDGERYFYRTCRACRRRIPEKSKEDSRSFMTAKPPADTRVGKNPIVKE